MAASYVTQGGGPSVPAGGTDTSDAFGPTITGNPAESAQSYPTMPQADTGGITVPRAVFHTGDGYVAHGDVTGGDSHSAPTSGGDRGNELPDVPRYAGPDVSGALYAGLVNPSGEQSAYPGPTAPEYNGADGPPGAHSNPSAGGVNPIGPDVYNPGESPHGAHDNAPYPDTSVRQNRQQGASQGPRG